MKTNTDTAKTLQYLRSYGDKGVHSFFLMKLVGSTRVAARVNDLKKQGYRIYSKSEEFDGVRGCRYFLNESPPIVKKQLVFKTDGTAYYL